MTRPGPSFIGFVTVLLAFVLHTERASAHGSVAPDDDLCLIEIGYYRAHFKVYQPHRRGHEQFCEDLPAPGESIFVMEYVHSGLGEVPIDFRIVRNVTGQGRFTRLADVERIVDLDSVTVFHQAAGIQEDVFTVRHEFEASGKFVGIVTLRQPDTNRIFTAVFPFDVGFTGFGWWPLLVLAVAVLQLNYLWMSGRLSRRRGKGAPRLAVIPGADSG